MIIKTSYSFMKPPPSARLIRGHRLAQGLAGYWLLNESSGNKIFDLSGGRHTGTFVGDPQWVPGKFGSSIDFDGTGDYVRVTENLSLRITSQITLVGWVKTSVSGDQAVIVKDDLTNRCFDLQLNSANKGRLVIWVSNAASVVDTPNTINDGLWHHLVGTYDGSALKFYLDGVGVNSKAKSGAIDDDSVDVTIGAYGDGNIEWNGQIDHVLIYNRALSASEIAELYLRPFGMFERKARTVLMSGYEVVAPPVGMAGAMTTNTGYWGW